MIANSKTVKQIGKSFLSMRHTRYIIACLIPLFIGTVAALILELLGGFVHSLLILVVFCFIYFFLIFPLVMGVIRFFYRSYKGDLLEDVLSVFHYFSDYEKYKRVLSLELVLFFKKLLVGLAVAVPLLAVIFLSSPAFYEFFGIFMPIWAQSLSYIIRIMMILGIFVYLLITLRYYLATFLFVADEDIHSLEAVYMSTLISKRTVIDYAFLIFSCFFIIAATLLVAPAVFTLPYLLIFYIIHCDSAVEQYNLSITDIKQNDTFSAEAS